jgi:competence protein ComEA
LTVSRSPAAPDAAGTHSTGGAAPGRPLNLNTATEAELDGLPGVGPVLAGRIVAWRAEHGPFTAVEELLEVSGIGTSTLDDLIDLVRV